MIDLLTKAIRTYFTGRGAQYVFKPADSIEESRQPDAMHLYLHIPFCRNLCPYCPYNKIPYEKRTALEYTQAMLQEIRLYGKLFGKMKISSIYIGGGTPTLLSEELEIIVAELRKTFDLTGTICLETNPGDVHEAIIVALKQIGVNQISVGVQSFQDRYLQFIGRNYSAIQAQKALQQLLEAEFDSINIDLLFALPGQTLQDMHYDLQNAVASGIQQITTYPLFTFPYSTIGQYLHLKKVKMPHLLQRRAQYYHIHRYLLEQHFERVSVWGFKRGSASRYSSVTRDGYLGLGAGAGSHFSDGFYLNTFSVREYITRCRSSRFPIALYMPFTPAMQRYFWLYWRLYEASVSKDALAEKFTPSDTRLQRMFSLFKRLDLLRESAESFDLTVSGAFWVHLLQNYFSLRYIDKIWGVAMKEAYPTEIRL